ncbi:MAG TPA: hypothetical protein VML75_20525, partial [Kofleriaceae bacterium]|nr:hypothetical protein [Kofleriaceae bacterium]
LEAVPLEAVRVAVAGPTAPPASSPDAPTAVIVEVRSGIETPVVGLTLATGAARYQGPVVFHMSARAALKDARLGARVLRARATGVRDGQLELGGDGGLDAAEVTSLRDSGALVVVVLPGS